MEQHDVPLQELIDGADPALNEAVDQYLPLEEAYASATTVSDTPIEGTTTTLFPLGASLAVASAR